VHWEEADGHERAAHALLEFFGREDCARDATLKDGARDATLKASIASSSFGAPGRHGGAGDGFALAFTAQSCRC
jgi:hypothetical protein